MRCSLKYLLAALAAALSLSTSYAAPEKQTVCTITVNSPDEKEVFRRFLPESKYRFVELVERNRSDWLASSCRAKVACDVLIVSAHYDGGNEFFSDQLESRDFLTVTELERVSCSGSCPTLFSRLKEVYLFGCNTLNPAPQSSASAEVVRSLVREGLSPKEAARQLKTLDAAHGESSRDRMRHVFKDVPAIYGFSSKAPIGPIAASTLERYFRSGGAREVGQGRASRSLVRHFSVFGLSVAGGVTERDPHIQARRDMCQFEDERVPDASKLAFVHEILQRKTPEARLYLDRIQRLTARLDDEARGQPEIARVLDRIGRDTKARARFIEDARESEQPPARVRLVNVAHDLGWLSLEQLQRELALMLAELQARAQVGVPEVNLACQLNRHRELDGRYSRPAAPPGGPGDSVGHAAMRACLGSAEGRERAVNALLSEREADVQVAQAYLRHRPIHDASELRRLADGIARMAPGDAQVRALEALGRHYLSDREVLDGLVRLYASTPSWTVQNAIAGILIRADRKALATPALMRTLVEQRRPSPRQTNMIDALLVRLSVT